MRVKLEDVCVRGSSNLKQSDVIDKKGDYPIFGAAGYIGNVDFYHQDKPYVAVVKDGAGIGRTTLYPAKSSVIGTMQYLLPKENVLPEYLCYVVRYMHLEKYFTGATIPHIYFKDYKNEEFNLDSFEKQQEIVSILGKVEDIIVARQQELQKLDELAKARFVEMFGKEENKKQLGEVTKKITDGSHNPPKGIDISEYLMLSSQNIWDELDLKGVRYLTKEDFESENKRTDIHDGDVLLTIVGTIGRTHVVRNDEKYTFQRSVAVIKPIDNILDGVFLSSFLKTDDAITQLEKGGHGSSQKGIYLQDVKKLLIPIPRYEKQIEFKNFVKQLDKSKFAVQKSLDEAQLLFDSLMQKYFG